MAVAEKWENGVLYASQRNRFFDGDELEIMIKGVEPVRVTVKNLKNEEGELIDNAPHPMMKLSFDCPVDVTASVGCVIFGGFNNIEFTEKENMIAKQLDEDAIAGQIVCGLRVGDPEIVVESKNAALAEALKYISDKFHHPYCNIRDKVRQKDSENSHRP